MHSATGIIDARSPRDIVVATSRMLSQFWQDGSDALAQEPPVPGVVHTIDDIDHCVQSVQAALRTRSLLGRDEEALDRLLGYLMVASVRGRQLSAR